MKKIFKVTGIVLASLLVLFVGSALTYRIVKSQGIVEPYTLNPEGGAKTVLVLTQSSSFKDEVMSGLAERTAGTGIRISVGEITKASLPVEENWDHIVLFTTVESGDIPEAADMLLRERKDQGLYSLIITADSGKWKKKDIEIDALTMASSKKNTILAVDRILSTILPLIEG